MSEAEVLTPILLRSSTPAPSEKVLLYLEGIARSGGASPVRDSFITDDGPPPDPLSFDPTNPAFAKLNSHSGSRVPSHRAPSNYAPSHRAQSYRAPSYHAPSHHSKVEGNGNGNGDLVDLAKSELSYEEDAQSNVQDGLRSEIARSLKAESAHNGANGELHKREPGPDDEPGPKYESYGSSFGNLGPPRESFFGPAPTQPWMMAGTPSRAENVPLPAESAWMSPRSAAKSWGHPPPPKSKASAMSAKTADVMIDVEAPSDPSRAPSHYTRAPSRNSHRSSGTAKQPEATAVSPVSPEPAATPNPLLQGISITYGPDGTTTINIPPPPSPVKEPQLSAERTPTEKAPTEKVPTEKAATDIIEDAPFSPGARSRARSRAGTDRPPASVAGTRYPPLPSTRGGAETDSDPSLLSPEMHPRSFRAPSKAPSKAPSAMSPKSNAWDFGGFNSFGTPFQFGESPTKAPSTKAPSHRPPPSNKQPSEVDTIPTNADHTRAASPYGDHTGRIQSERAPGVNGFGDFGAQPRGMSAYGGGSHLGGSQLGAGGYADEDGRFYGGRSNAGRGASAYGGDEQGEFNNARRSALPSAAGSAKGSAFQHGSRAGHSRVTSGDTSKSARSRALSPQSQAERSAHSRRSNLPKTDSQTTPTQSRAHSPDGLNDYETEIVQEILSTRTPRTSLAPSAIEAMSKLSHFHDQDLCILLHAAEDDMQHEVVKKAVRKAVAARIKKLGMKSDRESIKQYQKNFHDHDPSWHNTNRPSFNTEDPPAWAKEMLEHLANMEQRVAALGPQIERLKSGESSRTRTHSHANHGRSPRHHTTDEDEYDERTPRTQSMPLETQPTGTMADSMYRPGGTEYTIPGESVGGPEHDEFEDDDTHAPNGHVYTDRTPLTHDGDFAPRRRHDLLSSTSGRGDSPGQQVLEEELYRLRVREPSQSAMTHRSWEIARESVDGDRETQGAETEMPEIDGEGPGSPPLPPIPTTEPRDMVETQSNNQQAWQPDRYEQPQIAPWQKIHQRLLNWAIVWPMSELDSALGSTLRGQQVDEVALSIWSTQMYKRYVRSQLTEVPPGTVDRLFVPPNMADAINNAVFHGRHGDACGMLRDLWTPFGLDGIPRIIVVLCKHRSDPNHWVAHRFSLPEGTLTTYDTYPEKCLPDGRPLGWWFAIRIAWPGAMYPSPDHLMQKMVRLHRPLQLAIDNSVAAAGIWRNLLMGSRAERPVDLERLRDLINTEVKNLRQRKEQGKLSVSAAMRQNFWEEMGG